jgi:hypothetical protein
MKKTRRIRSRGWRTFSQPGAKFTSKVSYQQDVQPAILIARYLLLYIFKQFFTSWLVCASFRSDTHMAPTSLVKPLLKCDFMFFLGENNNWEVNGIEKNVRLG